MEQGQHCDRQASDRGTPNGTCRAKGVRGTQDRQISHLRLRAARESYAIRGGSERTQNRCASVGVFLVAPTIVPQDRNMVDCQREEARDTIETFSPTYLRLARRPPCPTLDTEARQVIPGPCDLHLRMQAGYGTIR